jgi:hypothetical protein
VTSSEVKTSLTVSLFLTVIFAGEKAKRFAWTSTVRVASWARQKLVGRRTINDSKTAALRLNCFIILRTASLIECDSAQRKNISVPLNYGHILWRHILEQELFIPPREPGAGTHVHDNSSRGPRCDAHRRNMTTGAVGLENLLSSVLRVVPAVYLFLSASIRAPLNLKRQSCNGSK